MTDYTQLPSSELEELSQVLIAEYENFKGQSLALDMTRGKPCAEQLDLANDMIDCLNGRYKAENGFDGRNYGLVDGLPETKKFFADFLEVAPEEVIVGGNSSLALMHDTVLRLLLKGAGPAATPWVEQKPVKFLCPCPGYDRHFAICETFGIDMVPVPLKNEGPDMDMIERLVAEDPSIKGIWCVPKYSNPTGITYADEVVDRLAAMTCAADDFRIFWDNAYTVHHLTETPDQLKNILAVCKETGNPDRVFIFGSTSKVTFAGAGMSAMGTSTDNVAWLVKLMGIQTIGPDKLNQLRHLQFLGDMDGVERHMKKHAAIIAPKFELVLKLLEQGLAGTQCAQWNEPKGGYFVSLDTMPGCASRTVELAAAAGVKLTPAGATFPYRKDPEDRNIRLAPTLPPLASIQTAMDLFVLCVKLASAEKMLSRKLV